MKRFGVILFFIMINTGISGQEDRFTVITNMTIFPDGRFESCHASSLVELGPGVIMAAWFAGSYEGAKDVAIWGSKLQNGMWSEPTVLAAGTDSQGNQSPCWNPVLFKTNGGILYLFYKEGPNPREWRGMVTESQDDGKSWTQPRMLPDGFLGPIKNKPVQLNDGTIVCPSSLETTEKWSVHIELTDENLTSWKKAEVEADSGVGVIQPAILVHRDGSLQMLCRSRQNVIYEAWSKNNGQSWSRLSKTSLPNPNSGIDAAILKDGRFMLIYNPLLSGKEWFNGRNILRAAISQNGIEWRDVCELENEKKGEFSYPAVIQGSDGKVHITYTYDRKNIKYVVLDLN